jgi:hypothetical protein
MTLHNEFTSIKSGIDERLAATDEQIGSIDATITSLEETLCVLGAERTNKQQECDQAEAVFRDITRRHTTHQARCEHARGTSIETTMHAELAALAIERQAAETAVHALQAEATSLKEAEIQYTKELAEARSHLTDLKDRRADLVANRDHFDAQHASSVRNDALAKLQAADAAITQLEAKLQKAHQARQQCQEETARALAPWPDVAWETLLAVCHFDAHPGIQALTLKKQLVELLEQGHTGDLSISRAAGVLGKPIPVQEICNYGGRPHLARLRTQGSLISNHTMMQLERDMDELERVHAEIQQAHQETHVRELQKRVASQQDQ